MPPSLDSSSFFPQYGCNKVYSIGGGELVALSSASQHSYTHYVNQQPVLSIGCKERGAHFTCMTTNESSPVSVSLSIKCRTKLCWEVLMERSRDMTFGTRKENSIRTKSMQLQSPRSLSFQEAWYLLRSMGVWSGKMETAVQCVSSGTGVPSPVVLSVGTTSGLQRGEEREVYL